MGRYIVRRILQMIPTVLGVIIITFILFNVVGGSPASMTLGKNVSPKTLEDFDEMRGFNRPLLFGWWTATRAFEDEAFGRNAGAWRAVKGAIFREVEKDRSGLLELPGGTNYAIPLAFSLRPDTGYRWTVSYRLKQGRALWRQTGNPEVELPPASEWTRFRLPFRVGANASALGRSATADGPVFSSLVKVEGGPLEIRRMALRREMPNPFHSQFFFYLGQIATLDFGESTYTKQKVSRMLKQGIWPSLLLTVPIFVAGLLLAISVSLVCAFFRNTWLDRTIVVASVILMSINYIVWIVLGQYVLSFKRGWFPLWGFESWLYLLLPVLIGVFSGLGSDVRFYRTLMLDEMYKDYVRTAFAKGVSRSGVLFRHVLKNAMIPILTTVVIAISSLYTGSLLLESFFGIPGLGNMGINAINYSDVDVVRAVVLIGAVLYVMANLVTDILYAFFDPRVKLE